MNSKSKIVSGISAAAAIGGGALMMNMTEPASPVEQEVVDDVKAVQIVTPSVQIPVIEIPKVNVATVETPEIKDVVVPTALDMEKYGISYYADSSSDVILPSVGDYSVSDGVSVGTAEVRSYGLNNTVQLARVPIYKINTYDNSYSVDVPGVGSVKVLNATVASVIAVVPELAGIAVENPSVTAEEIIRALVKMPNIDSARINAISAVIPTVSNPADRIPLVQQFMKEIKTVFKDQRGINHDSSFNIDNKSIQKWMKIYRLDEKYEMSSVPLEKGFRMIAEIHYPIDNDVLLENVDYYQKRGYDSALVTFGYKGENIGRLLDVVSFLRGVGMKVYFAYAGPESLHHSVFYDPDVLSVNLRRFASVCDGFILGWRRTSLHLFEQDRQYSDFVIKNVRQGNPGIIVLGEAYFGQTASSNERTINLQYNIPVNSSGTVITGLGYNGIAVESVVENLLSKIKGIPRVAVILGDKPYYRTRFNNGLSFEKNLQIKEYLEERWKRAGIIGTITLHGDGSDGNYEKLKNDNIGSCKMN